MMGRLGIFFVRLLEDRFDGWHIYVCVC